MADKPTPRPDQIADLAFFINNPKAGLLHDPGVGKTVTAAIYSEYCWKYKEWKSVWTQPRSLLKKNRDEILRFTNFGPDEVILVDGSPAKRAKMRASPNGKVFLMTPQCWSREWRELLECHPDVKASLHDEIHLAYAGHNSQRTQSWYMASRQMRSVIPMSGTLIKGRLDSVYPTLHVIAPQYYGTYEAFLNQHAASRDSFGTPEAWQNHEKLRHVLGAVSIRRTFESIYGKSSPVIQIEKCEMHPLQREKYDEFEAMALLELDDRFMEAENAGVTAIRCRQIMAHPERVKLPVAYNEKGKPTAYKDYNLLGKDIMTGKDERLLLHAENAYAAGERLAIFAALQPEQERIHRLLTDKGYRVGLINGNISGAERAKINEKFIAHRLDFVIGSPVTCGVGFNWNFLRQIIFVSLDYGDDTFTQAYKRGIRGHRSTPLLVTVLEYEDSIDQRIFKIVQQKSEDHHQVDETAEVVFLQAQEKLKKEAPKQAIEKGGFSMKNL